MNIDLKGQPSHYTAQQSAQQLRSFRLLSRFGCASASIISSFLATINHLLTNTYKSTFHTVDPKGEKGSFFVVFLDRLSLVCILLGYNSGWDFSE